MLGSPIKRLTWGTGRSSSSTTCLIRDDCFLIRSSCRPARSKALHYIYPRVPILAVPFCSAVMAFLSSVDPSSDDLVVVFGWRSAGSLSIPNSLSLSPPFGRGKIITWAGTGSPHLNRPLKLSLCRQAILLAIVAPYLHVSLSRNCCAHVHTTGPCQAAAFQRHSYILSPCSNLRGK